MRQGIASAFNASISAKRRFLREQAGELIAAIETVAAAFSRGNKLLIFGNGGSAADAQHIAAELVNRFKMDRPGLPAIALTTDSSALTSIANDCGYNQVFARQIEALGRPGDVVLAISTSGESPSVLHALRECRRRQITSIGLTGGTGGRLKALADVVLRVSATDDTARIQEAHILIGHVLCDQVEKMLFGSKKLRRR